MNPIRLAVIGAGTIGRQHMRLVMAEPGCQLVSVCDADPAQASVAARYGVAFYQDLQEMLCHQALEGVIIATPTEEHTSVGRICAARGLHMLVEKPIAATLEQGVQLLQTASANDAKVLVGHHRRHNPVVQKAQAIVQSGELGKLTAVSVLWTLLKPADYFEVAWHRQPGGGPVMTNLVHDIDNLRFICGEIRSLYAITSSATRGLPVEDAACIALEFESGALGTLVLADATPAPWSYELTSGENPIYPQTKENCYFFCGTRGALAFPQLRLWRYPETQVSGWHQPLACHDLPVIRADPLAAQLAHFCRVIRAEESPLVDGWDGLRTLAAALAVRESARLRKPIAPQPLPGRGEPMPPL